VSLWIVPCVRGTEATWPIIRIRIASVFFDLGWSVFFDLVLVDDLPVRLADTAVGVLHVAGPTAISVRAQRRRRQRLSKYIDSTILYIEKAPAIQCPRKHVNYTRIEGRGLLVHDPTSMSSGRGIRSTMSSGKHGCGVPVDVLLEM
jgi:hypothetical protein